MQTAGCVSSQSSRASASRQRRARDGHHIIVTVTDNGSLITIAVAEIWSTTAATVVTYALRANAETAALLDVGVYRHRAGRYRWQRLGVGAAVPFVRPFGLANGDVDASADGADRAIDDVNVPPTPSGRVSSGWRWTPRSVCPVPPTSPTTRP